MAEFENECVSSVAKVDSQAYRLVPSALNADDVASYVGMFLKLSEADNARFRHLRGRARFAATLVMLALQDPDGNVLDAQRRLEDGMTRDPAKLEGFLPAKSTLVALVKQIEKGEKSRVMPESFSFAPSFGGADTAAAAAAAVSVSHAASTSVSATLGGKGEWVELREQFRKMVVAALVTGQPHVWNDTAALKLIELGVCFLELSDSSARVATLAEPLVLEAAVNVIDVVDVAQGGMAQVSQYPSALGFTWELVLAFIIKRRYAEMGRNRTEFVDDPLVSPVRDELNKDVRFMGTCSLPLCERFGQSGERLGDLAVWLEECGKAITEGSLLPSWVFFPEEAAGPDLVFWLKLGNRFHVVFLQAKLKASVDALDAYRTTIPESTYVQKASTKSKKYVLPPKSEDFNMQLLNAVRDTNTVASVIRMIVAYPAALTKLATAFPAPKCSAVPDTCEPVKDLLLVVRGGQGSTNNAAKFFSKAHITFLDTIKGNE
jgi:hypothetical protein